MSENEMRYPAIIRQDSEGKDFVATFPDLEGAITGAATLDAALDEAADCLGSWLSSALSERKPIPAPSAIKPRQHNISVPLWIAPKIALYSAMLEQEITNSELARRLGVTENIVRRMLDPDHATKTIKIEAALKAVDRHLYLVSAA